MKSPYWNSAFVYIDRVALTAFLYTFIYFVLAYHLGAFSQEYSQTPEGIRDRNAAIALPIITSYLWMANHYLIERTINCLGKFVDYTHQSYNSTELTNAMYKVTGQNLKIAVLAGTSVAFSYLVTEDLLTVTLAPLQLLLNVTAFPFWIAAVMLLIQLVTITRMVIKQFLNNEKIDLFGIKKIIPISELVITNTIVCAFSLALIPLFWLGNEVPVIDKVIVGSVFVIMCFYLFWPVFKVQKQISNKKRLAIRRINDSVKRLFTNDEKGERRLSDDPVRLRRLSSLISTKREIANASEWPIDLPQSIKGLVFTLSIPLSWIAGSLVESLIAQLATL